LSHDKPSFLETQILDKYKDSFQTHSKHNNDRGEILPKIVILVGHSMGGFVARAIVVL
jgi:triacylglycerol esterase/lipase EstA (alpha/beta hydrolase family)